MVSGENGAFFYNDFDDKQEQAVQLDPDTKTVATVFSNVAKAVYWGIEFGHLPSRKFVNANASYHWRNMSVTVYGRNLNDEVYETYGHIGGGSPEFHLFGVSTVTPGRSWDVEFEMEL